MKLGPGDRDICAKQIYYFTNIRARCISVSLLFTIHNETGLNQCDFQGWGLHNCHHHDWSKAFDRVSHQILLNKLHKYGICGSILNWFNSYLNNRSQRVLFQGSQSNWAAVNSGVPQGSVLGPLLFNIFAFDLPFCVQSSLRQYADDTVLFRAIRHDTVVLQSDLHNIVTWCNLNRTSLNVKKM